MVTVWNKWGEKWWLKRTVLWGFRAGIFYHFPSTIWKFYYLLTYLLTYL